MWYEVLWRMLWGHETMMVLSMWTHDLCPQMQRVVDSLWSSAGMNGRYDWRSSSQMPGAIHGTWGMKFYDTGSWGHETIIVLVCKLMVYVHRCRELLTEYSSAAVDGQYDWRSSLQMPRDNTLNNFVSVIRLNVYGIILSQLWQVRQRELRIDVICKWHGWD